MLIDDCTNSFTKVIYMPIYTSGDHYPLLAQVVYIAYTPLPLHIHHFAKNGID